MNKVIALLCKSQNILPRSALLAIYESLVRTYLDYGHIITSSHQRGSIKKGVLKDFAEFSGKHLSTLWHRCFPVNCLKFLKTPFLQSTPG